MLINHYHPMQPITQGSATDISDFFKQLVEVQFSDKKAIKAQHKALMDYIKQPTATYFIRLYGSFSPKNYSQLRRGFLTEFKDGNRIVFCDNTFALNFTAAKVGGLYYSFQDINSLFNQEKLVFSFGTTEQERELSYFSPKGVKRQNINPVGWTLAHIKPVGTGYDGKSLTTFFPNPEREEWCELTKMRKLECEISEQEKKIAIAHFIRLVHPLNSFLIPKNNLVNYSGKRLGEEPALINYVHQYLKETFPTEMAELEKVAMEYDFPEGPIIDNITWLGVDLKVKEKKNPKKTQVVEENDVTEIIQNPDEVTEIMQNVDVDEDLALDKLLKSLRSIGMKAFKHGLYPALNANINATIEDVAIYFPDYSDYSLNSQKSRLSTAKSIFKNGLEDEALSIISNSNVE
ncbi:hypothetical protein ACYSNX_07300 [Myroides sp. LJL115]